MDLRKKQFNIDEKCSCSDILNDTRFLKTEIFTEWQLRDYNTFSKNILYLFLVYGKRFVISIKFIFLFK